MPYFYAKNVQRSKTEIKCSAKTLFLEVACHARKGFDLQLDAHLKFPEYIKNNPAVGPTEQAKI